MSDDKKKPGKSGAAKPPIIDAKAQKVGGDRSDTTEKAGSEAQKKEPSQKDAASAAAKDAKDAPKTIDDKPTSANKDVKEAPKSTSKADGKAAADKGAGATARQQDKKRSGGWFWKGLFGLLLLGGAAGGGAWLYQQYGPEKKLAALQARLAALERQAAGADLKALAQRVDALQAAQKTLAAEVTKLTELSALPQKVAALEERLNATESLRQQVRENAQALREMHEVLSRAREQLATLKEGIAQMAQAPAVGAENGGGQAVAPAAALLALKISVQETQRKLADLVRQLSEVRKAADPARMEMLEGRLKRQEEALLRLRTELQESIEKAMAQALKAEQAARGAHAAVAKLKANPPMPKISPPPAAMAYAALRQKAKTGAPFAAELKNLAALLPGARPVDALMPFAESGVPTEKALAAALDTVVAQLQEQAAAATRQEDEGVLGALQQRLSKVVKVRRAGEVDWLAVAQKMRTALAKGGLGAALAVLPARAGKMPQALAAWVSKARARQQVDAALDAMADVVLQKTPANR